MLGAPAFLGLAYVLEGLNNPSLFTRSYILAEYGHILFWPKYNGFRIFSADDSLLAGSAKAAGRSVGSLVGGVAEIPEMVLDVRFKDINKIFLDRDAAIRRGRLIQNEDSFVRGKIRDSSGTVPVKLRLKGDFLDHIQGRKWSFRVHTRKGEQYMGMRRFSVQHPRVRGFHSEPVFFDLARSYGILAPRWELVNLTLNGEDLGMMSVEEHFSKELLESQSRREGIILKFDESLVWLSPDGKPPQRFNGIYDDYRNSVVDTFGSGKVFESPVFREHYRVAAGMLRSFVAGESKASDIFDVDRLGAYLAISEAFGARHAIRWHNLRYYMNPITMKLEPIAFDASLKGREEGMASVNSAEPISVAMLSDPLVMKRFGEVMAELAQQAESGELLERLRLYEKDRYEILAAEFLYLNPYPFEQVIDRAMDISGLDESAYFAAEPREIVGIAPADKYPLKVHAFRVFEGDTEYLEIQSAIPYPVELTGVALQGFGDGAPVLSVEGFPVTLPARSMDSDPLIQRVTLPVELRESPLQLAGSTEGSAFIEPVSGYFPLYAAPAIPVQTVESVLAANEFLKFDAASSRLTSRPGEWEVSSLISLPEGVGLTLTAGTDIRFAADAALVVRGPVDFNGTVEQPVRLSSQKQGETWLGMAIMGAGEPSSWTNVQVSNTRGVKLDAWLLMGGTNFHNTPVTIRDSSIRHHKGEDGLNIMNTNFITQNLVIEDTLSDGFDCDFCTGEVNGGEFIDIGSAGGGDAIDVSLSDISVDGVRFFNVSDKAVSIGEASRAKATRLLVEASGTGAAAKDGSYLELEDSRIEGAKVSALMAYIKKPEFGTAELKAKRLTLNNNRVTAVAQTGSIINIDGQQVTTEDVDVDEMYETIMRPGLRKPKPVEAESNAGT
ncbi:MAG: CotH kinase family protein [Gammaproteobacteria bacterium]